MALSQTAQDFVSVINRRYKDQATFFLNAFWPEYSKNAEEVWKNVQKMVELDTAKGGEGNDLDEFSSHRFLEAFGDTLSVNKMREVLRELHIDRKKRMSLIEYLVVKYKQDVKTLLARPQGTNEDLIKAQQALENVQKEIDKIENQKKTLEAASQGTGVKANSAKNELAQLLTKDNTDLNRALLTAEAAVRKAQKRGGDAQGSLWWIDRELTEMKKYKPQSKGGIKK
eukprot:TRINITY_DN4715_c0_g1_i1.p1 TRINITY_DN4715_c0_g1~~TRINITY_DN4715_c0_g1_i1.p1  ORF type:complete len:227 (-),score=59.88 TRINITY_DN4715_c0_g1_i1:52-732(-)